MGGMYKEIVNPPPKARFRTYSCHVPSHVYEAAKTGSNNLQPRLNGALTLPTRISSNQLCSPLTDPQNGQHGIDSGHGREHTRIRNPQLLQPPDLQILIHDRELVVPHIAHLRRSSGMVHGMRDAARVLGELLVRLQLIARRDLALDPVLERRLLRDLAGCAQSEHEGRGVVAFGVGEVAEVEGGLHAWVGGGQVYAAARAWAWDVGRHAECVDGLVVA